MEKQATPEELRHAVNFVCLEAVVRALIAHHPDPVALRQTHDHLLSQIQGWAAMKAGPNPVGELLKAHTERLFAPPVQLHTDN